MFRISGKTIRGACAAVIVLDALFIAITGLTDISQAASANRIVQLFDLKREGNIAVWYSSVLLLLTAAHAFAITGSQDAARNGGLFRAAWTLTGVAFLWLSMDETAQIHEQSGMLFTKVFGRVRWLTDASGHGVFAWVLIWLPAILLFVVCMLAIARVWLAFYRPSRILALSGVACFAGVIMAETVQAALSRAGYERSIEGVIEEGLELVGTTLFLVSFHLYLTASQAGRVRKTGLTVTAGTTSSLQTGC